jgi:hypothetical protein
MHLSPYFPVGIPTSAQFVDFLWVMASAALLTGLGRLLVPRLPTEIQLVAGWGALCVVLTLWGCATGASMLGPLVILALVGTAGLAWRGSGSLGQGLWRLVALSAGIWFVMIPVGPSQSDTWLNLLPNAAYLFDHGMFPRADRAESYSFLPVAPYNTQFVAYLASVLDERLIPSAQGLFNIVLQCAAGGLLARALSPRGGEIGWTEAALGLLLAIPLNPGFLPHAFFASYGEAPLAVTAMMAIWLGARLLGNEGLPRAERQQILLALALVLAAMTNTKQSALELALSIEIAGLIVIVSGRARQVPSILDSWHILPPAILYGVWRWYATTSFPVGELKLLPVNQWNIALIPQIFAGIIHAISQRGVYFALILLFFILTVSWVRRGERDSKTVALLAGSIAIIFHHIFITITYVTHFDPRWAVDAHSYFRYMTQLSLILMLGYVVLLQDWYRARAAALGPDQRRRLAAWSCGAILVLPFLGSYWLRFDLVTPQPEIAQAIEASKAKLDQHAALAVLVPGDPDDIGGSFARGTLLYIAPRLSFPHIRTVTGEDAATLGSLAAAGYHQALVGCSDDLPADLHAPANALALITYGKGGWAVSDHWPYPPHLRERHWSAMIPRDSFCGGPEPRHRS